MATWPGELDLNKFIERYRDLMTRDPSEWRKLYENRWPIAEPVQYGGRNAGKSAEREKQLKLALAKLDFAKTVEALDDAYKAKLRRIVGIDWAAPGSGDKSVEVTARMLPNGTIFIEEMREMPADDSLPPPVEKPRRPVDFFPSKIERIAKMPRYPGVWG